MSIFGALLGFLALVYLLTRQGGRRGARRSVKRRSANRPPHLSGSVRSDLVSALRNQGYSKKAAQRAAAQAKGNTFDAMFKDALRKKA